MAVEWMARGLAMGCSEYACRLLSAGAQKAGENECCLKNQDPLRLWVTRCPVYITVGVGERSNDLKEDDSRANWQRASILQIKKWC